MKSIMEEASSVIKAIEKGWIEAGKPQEFSVKVYEEATKNFLGMTSKPAKIAIFFDEKAAQPQAKHQRPAPARREEHARPAQQPRRAPQPAARPERPERPQQHAQQRPQHQPQPQQEAPQTQERRQREVWTPEMLDAVNTWLQESLSLMGVTNRSFNTDIKSYYLKINFEQPLFEDRDKERTIFRSFAHLLMQSLRNKFKKGFRGCKVILNSPAQ